MPQLTEKDPEPVGYAPMRTNLENQLSFSHHGGRASSLEEATAQATQKAGEFFGRHQDKEAAIWREVATWLKEKAQDCRTEQKKYDAAKVLR